MAVLVLVGTAVLAIAVVALGRRALVGLVVVGMAVGANASGTPGGVALSRLGPFPAPAAPSLLCS